MTGQTNPLQRPISRRGFLRGAAVAAAGAVGLSAVGITGCKRDKKEEESSLMVPESDLVTLSDLEEVEPDEFITDDKTYKIRAGTMLWTISDNLAVMLVTGKTSSPLSRVGLFDLKTGEGTIVLNKAVGHKDGYDIYEVRGSKSALVWTEVNYETYDWSVYGAGVSSGGELGSPVLYDSGDANYDPPLLCAVDNRAVWTVCPNEHGEASDQDSEARTCAVGASDHSTLLVSHGRINAIPEASGSTVTLVPRADLETVHYRLMAMNPATGETLAQVLFPQGVRPMDAIYLNNRFAFEIEASYTSDSAIAQVGTYYDLGDGRYLRMSRVPACPPAWCNGRLVAKNGKVIVCVNPTDGKYCTLEAPSNSASYGDYLASTGECGSITTYATVNDASDATVSQVHIRTFAVK